MPYYQYLRNLPEDEKQRTAAGLLRLKAALAQHVPHKTVNENLLVATWNIREFDSKNYGFRMEEADKKTRYYKTYWRTHQLSDHLPMWTELKIDFSVDYLNNL